VLTQRGAERYDFAGVSYGPGASVRSLAGAVISPAGKRIEVKRQMIADRAAYPSFVLYADLDGPDHQLPGVVVPDRSSSTPGNRRSATSHPPAARVRLQEEIPARAKTLRRPPPAAFLVHLGVRDLHPGLTTEEKDGVVVQTYVVRRAAAARRRRHAAPARPRVTRRHPAEDDHLGRSAYRPQRLVGRRPVRPRHYQ
jgi:hypothetical protein